MIINQNTKELSNFLTDPKSWPLFLDHFYYLDQKLDIRTITGTKKVSFVPELEGDNVTIYISNQTLKFKYQFTIIAKDEGSELTLNTDYIIPFIESRALRLMGINLMLKNDSILDNIKHFVDFGHIH